MNVSTNEGTDPLFVYFLSGLSHPIKSSILCDTSINKTEKLKNYANGVENTEEKIEDTNIQSPFFFLSWDERYVIEHNKIT